MDRKGTIKFLESERDSRSSNQIRMKYNGAIEFLRQDEVHRRIINKITRKGGRRYSVHVPLGDGRFVELTDFLSNIRREVEKEIIK